MKRQFNRWSFYLCLVCLALFFYSRLFGIWILTPPVLILCMGLTAFVMAIVGFGGITGWQTALRSWAALLLSLGLSLILAVWITSPEEQWIKTDDSPDHRYNISFYLTNEGATTSFGVVGKLDGPLWFKKKVYSDYHIDHANVEWKNNHVVSINGHVVNLKKGVYYDYSKD